MHRSIRVDKQTKAKIDALLAKANDKSFGRKLRPDDLVCYAIERVTAKDLEELRNQSLTNKDRLEMLFHDHRRRKKGLTKDQFLGVILDGKVALRENEIATGKPSS